MSELETSDLSVREKNLWGDLLTDGVVALYYFPKLFWVVLAGDAALRGAAMVKLITGTIMVAIFARAALAAFLHTRQAPEPLDERDISINNRASVLYGRILTGGILALLVGVMMQEMDFGHSIAWPLILSPLVLAHLLLLTLMLASAGNNVMKIVLYRRGL